MRFCLLSGLGHCWHRAEAEKGADRPEPLGPSAGGLSEPPVQRLLSDHQGEWWFFGINRRVWSQFDSVNRAAQSSNYERVGDLSL